jgi:hypothetical protein
LEFKEPSGKVVFQPELHIFTKEIIPSSKGSPILPRSTTRNQILIGKPAIPESALLTSDYQPKLDYVLFVDGTRWGPDKLKNAKRIEGVRQGAAMEHRAAQRK